MDRGEDGRQAGANPRRSSPIRIGCQAMRGPHRERARHGAGPPRPGMAGGPLHATGIWPVPSGRNGNIPSNRLHLPAASPKNIPAGPSSSDHVACASRRDASRYDRVFLGCRWVMAPPCDAITAATICLHCPDHKSRAAKTSPAIGILRCRLMLNLSSYLHSCAICRKGNHFETGRYHSQDNPTDFVGLARGRPWIINNCEPRAASRRH